MTSRWILTLCLVLTLAFVCSCGDKKDDEPEELSVADQYSQEQGSPFKAADIKQFSEEIAPALDAVFTNGDEYANERAIWQGRMRLEAHDNLFSRLGIQGGEGKVVYQGRSYMKQNSYGKEILRYNVRVFVDGMVQRNISCKVFVSVAETGMVVDNIKIDEF